MIPSERHTVQMDVLEDLPPDAARRSLLEAFCLLPCLERMGVPALIRATFRLLDESGSGFLELSTYHALMQCLVSGYVQSP